MSSTLRICAFPSLVLASALAVSACASGPDPDSFSGRVAAEGGEVAAIGEKWNKAEAMVIEGQSLREDGEDDVDEGEKLISKGEKRIKDGRKKVSKGERMIAEGQRQKAEAEEAYRVRQIGQPQT